MEKAEAREKERMKDEQRRQKKMEDAFKKLLKPHGGDWTTDTKWETVRGQFENESAFNAIPLEAERARLFTELVNQLEEACMHSKSVKTKKKSKKQSRHRSRSRSVSISCRLSLQQSNKNDSINSFEKVLHNVSFMDSIRYLPYKFDFRYNRLSLSTNIQRHHQITVKMDFKYKFFIDVSKM